MNSIQSTALASSLLLLSHGISYAEEKKESPATGLLEFGEGNYIEGVGLILLGPDAYNNKKPVGAKGLPKRALGNSGLTGWNPRLSLYNCGHCESPILALRIQNSIDSIGKDAMPALFSFKSDGESGTDSLNFTGAVVFDLYTFSDHKYWGYDEDNFGVHFRIGADFEYLKPGKAATLDSREYYVGASFLAPVLGDGMFDLKGAQASTMDAGFHFNDNRITGETSTSYSIEWKPALRGLFGRNIPLSWDDLVEATEKIDVDSLAGGSKKTPKDVGEGESPLETNTDKHYFFMQPSFGVEKFMDKASGMEDDYCLCGGFDAGLSVWHDFATLTYSLDVMHGVSSGDTHIFHEAGLRFKPYADNPLSIDVTYQVGEKAPDFQKSDLFAVGLGLKF